MIKEDSGCIQKQYANFRLTIKLCWKKETNLEKMLCKLTVERNSSEFPWK